MGADGIRVLSFSADAPAAGDVVGVQMVANTGHVELIAPESRAWAQAKRAIAVAFSTPGDGK